MKSKQYLKHLSISLFAVLAFHHALVYLLPLGLDPRTALIYDSFLFCLFALGAVIIAPALNRDKETFVLRFLVLTTIQMLTFIGAITVLIVLQIDNIRLIGFHLIGVFIPLLTIQSTLLIRLTKEH